MAQVRILTSQLATEAKAPSGRDGRHQRWNKPRRAQLTEAFVENLPRPPKGRSDYWMRCTHTRGFSVRVYQPDQNGEVPKIFGVTVSIKDREKYYQIGRFGTMKADLARDEARSIIDNVKHDRPWDFHRKKDVSLFTVQDLFHEWKANYWPAGLDPATQERYQRFWDRFIPQKFRYMRLVEVQTTDLQEIHTKIRDGGIEYTRRLKINTVEAVSKPSKSQANRTMAMLNGMFKYQMEKHPDKRNGLAFNPCKAVTYDQESEESYTELSRFQLQELRQFLEAPENRCSPYSRAEGRFPGVPLDVIALIFHTGLRHKEALHLTWKQINFEHGYLKFKVKKNGAKRPRVTPTKYVRITTPAQALLKRIWDQQGPNRGEFVFPCHLNPKKPWYNIQGTWEEIRGAGCLDLPEGTRLHDLRHALATDLLRSGMEREEVKEYMGWRSIDSANRYMHAVTRASHQKAEAIITMRGLHPGEKKPSLLESIARKLVNRRKAKLLANHRLIEGKVPSLDPAPQSPAKSKPKKDKAPKAIPRLTRNST